MNATDQAKNGFKTFIITLVISLVIFSVIYYVATDTSQPISIEDGVQKQSNAQDSDAVVAVASNDSSVFKELSSQKLNVPQRNVLGSAATTETTQSTVPSTGITEITYAFILSLAVLGLGAYAWVTNPRAKALRIFEKDFLDSLK